MSNDGISEKLKVTEGYFDGMLTAACFVIFLHSTSGQKNRVYWYSFPVSELCVCIQESLIHSADNRKWTEGEKGLFSEYGLNL